MKINTKTGEIKKEPLKVQQHLTLTPIQKLQRTVMSCLLWEDQFYENGENISDRIRVLVPQCSAQDVVDTAVKAREQMKLRHVPLLLIRELARQKHAGSMVGKALTRVIQRVDEIPEFLAIYWKDKKCPISKQVKQGLAGAFRKFDTYQFAKYDRDTAIKLRDVLFLSHAKPIDGKEGRTKEWRKSMVVVNNDYTLGAKERLYKQIVDGTLPTPDTWEVALSSGADKKETFTRLLNDNKLGYMALLRNLRNMLEAGVSDVLVGEKLLAGAAKSKALPFRYLAAARACPQWKSMIDQAMQESVKHLDMMYGSTKLLIDVSGSMYSKLSNKSDLTRIDAASALAVLICGICSDVRVFTFSDRLVEIKAVEGMGLVEEIHNSQLHSGTRLGDAIRGLNQVPAERFIVITDEQSADSVGAPQSTVGYMINVASYQNGVGYDKWTKIDGFSESVVSFIQEYEASMSMAAA
jgi:60 kDa SS-A/Ro ribonucleoprotein